MIPLMSDHAATSSWAASRPRAAGRSRRFDIDESPTRSRARRWRKIGIDVRDPTQAGRHAVGRRAPVRGDRPRRLFRRQGADPRRADLGARRHAGLDRAALRRPGARPRPRRRSSSPTTSITPMPSATGSPCSIAARRSAPSARTRSAARSCSSMMAGGKELRGAGGRAGRVRPRRRRQGHPRPRALARGRRRRRARHGRRPEAGSRGRQALRRGGAPAAALSRPTPHRLRSPRVGSVVIVRT